PTSPAAPATPAPDPAPASRRQDPADSVYRAGRSALGKGDYRQAEAAFRRVTASWPKSAYANDATYFQAYALYRIGNTSDLQRGRQVLAVLTDTARAVPVPLRRDASNLDLRICGVLAQRGEVACSPLVRDRADELLAGGFGGAIAGAGEAGVTAAAEAMSSVEMQRVMGQAQVAAADAAGERARADAEAMAHPEVQRAIAGAGL
ncbi:tetratricopeptide repeat protein, partial [Roseisolibacter sp. H3M3-2]|uniref:outer membrane protein assembly factor BamD n=1 Tax=Roseisolibacter sp. H3M3-2 TaxID=3031323 RepID=UPI0023DCDB5A